MVNQFFSVVNLRICDNVSKVMFYFEQFEIERIHSLTKLHNEATQLQHITVSNSLLHTVYRLRMDNFI